MSDVYQAMVKWTEDVSIEHAAENLFVSKDTIIKIYDRCRLICSNYMRTMRFDENSIVEVDESLLAHYKYNEGEFTKNM